MAKRIGTKRWRLAEELESTLRALQLSGDIIKSRAQHGFQVTNLNQYLAPTEINAQQSVTGKVIGMGLDHELHDRRYLLIEGTDSKIHYVRATESIVKARDSRQFTDGDVITLQVKTFIPKDLNHQNNQPLKTSKPISYIAVINHKYQQEKQQQQKYRKQHEKNQANEHSR